MQQSRTKENKHSYNKDQENKILTKKETSSPVLKLASHNASVDDSKLAKNLESWTQYFYSKCTAKNLITSSAIALAVFSMTDPVATLNIAANLLMKTGLVSQQLSHQIRRAIANGATTAVVAGVSAAETIAGDIPEMMTPLALAASGIIGINYGVQNKSAMEHLRSKTSFLTSTVPVSISVLSTEIGNKFMELNMAKHEGHAIAVSKFTEVLVSRYIKAHHATEFPDVDISSFEKMTVRPAAILGYLMSRDFSSSIATFLNDPSKWRRDFTQYGEF